MENIRKNIKKLIARGTNKHSASPRPKIVKNLATFLSKNQLFDFAVPNYSFRSEANGLSVQSPKFKKENDFSPKKKAWLTKPFDSFPEDFESQIFDFMLPKRENRAFKVRNSKEINK